MYEAFLANNLVEIDKTVIKSSLEKIRDTELEILFRECGGAVVNSGLYRVHTPQSCEFWSRILNKYFAGYGGKIYPFGFDWLGRQFAINGSNSKVIASFDPATIQGYELEESIVSFHNTDMVVNRDDTVSENAFGLFLKELGVNKLSYNECIAHKVPLFLGGTDDISNFQVLDVEVHWEMQYQIYNQVKNLPPGTKINSVKFE
jgi:hypothetical protein